MPTPPVERPLAQRLVALEGMLERIVPVPEEWLTGKGRASTRNGDDKHEMECIPCSSYTEMISAWRKALKWTDGLDYALSVMLAAVTSTKGVGDQLWVKVIGPAACAKSTLCEALSTNTQYILAKSTIRGFHSGYSADGDPNTDHSLIPLVRDKTLITKDGDTLLQSPNLPQILSEGRDLYDGTARTHYRNAKSTDYTNIRMTWLLCGTSSLRSIDSSELGERFLDCVIMDGIDEDLEDEILEMVVQRAQRNRAIEVNGELYAPEQSHAMQLTGGYVTHLRENAIQLLEGVQASTETLTHITRLAKFVACMRARPSNVQDESAERELATRLVEQHLRLANCLAVVLNKQEVDSEVMDRVKRVAFDTARGQTLDIIDSLYSKVAGPRKAQSSESIGMTAQLTGYKTKTLLRFLSQIGVVEQTTVKKVRGIVGKVKWRLTKRMQRLFTDVLQ